MYSFVSIVSARLSQHFSVILDGRAFLDLSNAMVS